MHTICMYIYPYVYAHIGRAAEQAARRVGSESVARLFAPQQQHRSCHRQEQQDQK